MSPLARALDAAYIGCVATTAITGATRTQGVQRWSKAAQMPLLIAKVVARRGSAPRAAAPQGLLVAALVASAAGDHFMFQEEFAPRAPHRFSARHLGLGAASFGVGHLGYACLLRRRGARLSLAAVLPRAAVAAESGLTVRRYAPEVLPVVSPYGLVLALASSLAEEAAVSGRVSRARSLRLGAWLFPVSDALIVQRRLRLHGAVAQALAEIGVQLTYGAAQWFLVDALAEGGR